MNANELADELDNLEIVCKNPSHLIGMETYEQAFLRCNSKLKMKKEAATMLRQQQAELDRAVELYTDKAIENEALLKFIDKRGETGQLIIWKAQEK